MKELDVIEQLPKVLQACLANVAKTSIDSVEREVLLANGMRADMVVGLTLLGRRRTLLVEAKSSGQPRWAREAANQLKRMMQEGEVQDAYPVFVSPYISNASGQILRDNDIGYFDLAGNCLLMVDNVYVEKASAENPFREKRTEASLFSPKASRVLRALLDDPKAWQQVQQLAIAAEVSIGLASKVKRQLDDREWIQTGSDGIRIAQPEQLLLAWAERYSYKQSEVGEYYSLDDIAETETAIAEWCRESDVMYALTGFSGARLSSPRVRYNRATIYLAAKSESLSANTGLKRVESGGNVLLLRPYDDGIFQGSRILYGLRAVSPIQLYLDLQSMPGRGEEAAEEVLVRELRPLWQ